MGIFYNPYSQTETWTAQGAIMTWHKGPNAASNINNPMLMLQIQIQYQRAVQAFYPIATDATAALSKINMAGAPRGQMTIGSIFTPSKTGLKTFLTAVADPCKDAKKVITVKLKPFGNVKCNTAASGGNTTGISQGEEFTLTGVELESVGVQIQGGEVAIVNLPTTYSFTDMDLN